MPHRIAVLMDSHIVSGPARQLAAVIPPLRARGFDLQVITFHRRGTPPSPHARFLHDLGIPHRVLEDAGPLDPRLPARVGSVLEEWRPEIVQTHSYRPTALVALLRLRPRPWRWIAFFHGATSENRKVRFYHWLDRRLLGRADRVVVVAESQREALKEEGIGRVTVLGNANILQSFAAPDAHEHLERLARMPHPRLGVIGRLSPEKGVDVFLEAVARLRRTGIALSASIIGDGPEWESLVRQAERLGLTDCVQFFGRQPVVPATYRELDLLVVPSRSEGFPNVLLEALSEDCPVVATEVGGIPEIVGESGSAILVPPGSPELLAAAILEGLRSGRQSAAQRGRRRVAEAWSLDRRVADHARLYREVLGCAA